MPSDVFLQLDGSLAELPIELENINVIIAGSTVYLSTDFSLYMTLDQDSGVMIQLPPFFKDQIQGMCGNYDHNSGNDLIDSNGRDVRSQNHAYSVFGNSWQVDDPENAG